MAQVFIRVELRGNPTWQDYDNLHTLMENNRWYRRIEGLNGISELPHAMYQGTSEAAQGDISRAVSNLIAAQVWGSNIVLVMLAEQWAQSANA